MECWCNEILQVINKKIPHLCSEWLFEGLEYENAKQEDKSELDKLGKIVKTLEEELANKAEKIKSQENAIKKHREDANTLN